MVLTCQYCGKQYEGRRDSKYCSNQCRVLSKTKTCVVCGKEFVQSHSSQKCCSVGCANIASSNPRKYGYRIKERVCQHCGQKYTGRSNSFYCSAECRKKHDKQQKQKRLESVETFLSDHGKEPTGRKKITWERIEKYMKEHDVQYVEAYNAVKEENMMSQQEITVLRKMKGQKAETVKIIQNIEGIACLIGKPYDVQEVENGILFISTQGQVIAERGEKALISVKPHRIPKYRKIMEENENG